MELLRGSIKKLYFKYLSAAFGSAFLSSIYAIVDTAMVGQYHGPEGSAALAVVAPIWNLIYSLGLLMGIGGSVLFTAIRGRDGGHGSQESANQYFTVSIIGSAVLSAIVLTGLLFFDEPLLAAFGAQDDTLTIALNYVRGVKLAAPLFVFNQALAAYLRNDGAPGLAAGAVIGGGIFNIFGDYFFVFVCDMGSYGAGLATAIAAAISFLGLMSHFLSRKNTLRLVRPKGLCRKLKDVCVTGFSTFFVDVAMGILTILFNRQIVTSLGTDALAVYGVVVNVSTFVQCCAYSVGQSAQPIISANWGANQGSRIRQVLRYALLTAAVFGLAWTALSLAIPNVYVRIFMSPTASVLAIAPAIIRQYAISFLLLPFNIFSTYYFQAVMQPKTAFLISVGRGMVISGALIFLLPALFGADAIWFAMPVTELAIAIGVTVSMRRSISRLPGE